MNKSTAKGSSVTASAQPEIAEDGIRPRSDQTRLRLVVPIGVIVAVAIICVIVAVLTSARRADEVSLNREQELIQQAIADRGVRILRELESVAATQRAADAIGRNYNAQWVDRRVGNWLETYFDHDLVAVVDAADKVEYARSRSSDAPGAINWPMELAAVLDLLRGRDRRCIERRRSRHRCDRIQVRPSRIAALIQRFTERPAIVAAVAVGSDDDLAAGNAGAPIVVAVKYIDDAMLREIGSRLQLPELRLLDDRRERRRNAGHRHYRPARQRGCALCLETDQARRPDCRAGAAFHARGARRLRGADRPGDCTTCGAPRRKSPPAKPNCVTSRLHDPVCGLPNRIYFGERLESMIDEVRRGGPSAAVFFIDLDHFKDVNDTLGHHVGDELILNVTKRLSHVMRDDDLVARLGGDEFAIITNCGSDSYSLQAIAGRILAAVCAPYSISGHNIVIGASIGIAVIDRRAKDAGDILRYADMALYRAKNEGRNRACIYDAAMDADLSQRKLLEGDLLYAIKNDGLNAAYQPIVNASGDKMIGVEALARWTHPTAGVIPPSEFIPIAENSGLIFELGEWMLRRACLDGRDWPGLTVAVNVSPLQFRRPDFVDLVERILKETAFDPSRLELELTESTLLGNLEMAELSMLRLKAIGVRFALDDFGTGYSSLQYLRRFPFDKLKIDSSFVRSIETAPDAASIVHAVVSLGRGLGMKVTAEGVESAEQHLFLRAAGVHSMQGYRFGRPGPAADVGARLAAPDDYRVVNPDQEIALAS